ncbi:MAG: DNA polymerase III subunit delta, partial [Gemmatales bacterium]|nr:DNA polymerase III subunit delta [Gemmatales bacterium]MDW8385954.1 DNA polymerase III subunit delta [Gemmatales bacterium]
RLLGDLLDQGNEPMQLLGAFSWHLRRLAQVHRLKQRGVSTFAAVKQAGLHRAEQAEQLLHRLGPRAERLYDWLLDADLRLKSSGDLPPRTVLERLVVRLAS